MLTNDADLPLFNSLINRRCLSDIKSAGYEGIKDFVAGMLGDELMKRTPISDYERGTRDGYKAALHAIRKITDFVDGQM